MRALRWLWLGLLPVLLGAPAFIYRPDLAVRVATGVIAHDICSKTFISGFDAKTAFDEMMTWPSFRRLRWGLGHSYMFASARD